MKIFSPIPPERKQWGGGGSDEGVKPRIQNSLNRHAPRGMEIKDKQRAVTIA